jgi:murein DD-endopeptidase MepM/ murein hydrolase activator NlpD
MMPGFHPGVDLVAPSDTPILAAAGGRVIFAGQKGGYGNAIEIDHGNGLITRYGRASRILVHEGDLVLPRHHVADVGTTGRSTGRNLCASTRRSGNVCAGPRRPD